MARTDINRYRGDTNDLVLLLTQNRETFDLTGCSATLSVSTEEAPTGSTYVFQSSATVDTDAGSLSFPVTAENADNLGTFYYDVELTDGAGKKKTIRKGAMVFSQDITK